MGNRTRAKTLNWPPKPDASATSASATADADRVFKKTETRLKDSFHASERALRRLQCSVDRKEAPGLLKLGGAGRSDTGTSR